MFGVFLRGFTLKNSLGISALVLFFCLQLACLKHGLLAAGASGTEEFVHTVFAVVEAVVQHPPIVIDHCVIVVDHLLPPLAALVFSLTGSSIHLVTHPLYIFYLFIYFSTDIDNTSNTNKNNKMPAKDRKTPEGTSTLIILYHSQCDHLSGKPGKPENVRELLGNFIVSGEWSPCVYLLYRSFRFCCFSVLFAVV